MTAPAQVYGYAHRGSIAGPSELDGYWYVRCSAINPMRPVGPYAAAVPDLAVDDRVLLTQIGTTRDDLVITGKLPATPWDSHLPIDIDDVTGLQAALDARATDAELAAAVAALTAANGVQDGRLTAVEGVDTTQNGRLTAVEGVNTTQDGRLTSAEGRLTSAEGRLTTNETNIAANTGNITANTSAVALLNTWARYQDHDLDIYGDVLSSFPRSLVGNQATTPTGRILWWRTRLRRDVSLSQIRVGYQTGGVGGTSTAAIFRSSTALGVYDRVASVASAPAAGVKSYGFTATAFTRGEYILVALLLTGQTTSVALAVQAGAVPVAAVSILNPSSTNIVWGQQNATVMPTTINPADGTWGNTTIPWWLAVA